MGLWEWRAVFRRPLLVAILLGAGSLGLIGTGVFGVWSSSQERAQFEALKSGAGVHVEATLTEAFEMDTQTTRTSRSHNREPELCPLYSFTSDGREYTLLDTTDCSTRSEEITIGATTPVVFDPTDPSIAFIDSADTASSLDGSVGSSVVMVVIGIVLAVVTPFAVVRARMRARPRRRRI